MPFVEAMGNEFQRGLESLKEAPLGAARFAAGEGRHGAFRAASPSSSRAADSSTTPPRSPHPLYDAVVFDVGGVIVDSPLVTIARYEADLGLPKHAINRMIVSAGERGSFQRLERGELSVDGFVDHFERECR